MIPLTDVDPKHVPTHLSLQNPDVFESPHDQTEDPQALTFDDLLSFAFQVAKGMEFLSAKNVRDNCATSVDTNTLSTETLMFTFSFCFLLMHNLTRDKVISQSIDCLTDKIDNFL